jgi:hypothetical protein
MRHYTQTRFKVLVAEFIQKSELYAQHWSQHSRISEYPLFISFYLISITFPIPVTIPLPTHLGQTSAISAASPPDLSPLVK